MFFVCVFFLGFFISTLLYHPYLRDRTSLRDTNSPTLDQLHSVIVFGINTLLVLGVSAVAVMVSGKCFYLKGGWKKASKETVVIIQ